MNGREIPRRIVYDASNVEVSQSYQPKSYRKGSQSERNPVKTALGKQVPEGWLITARIGPLTWWTLALLNQCLINRHW